MELEDKETLKKAIVKAEVLLGILEMQGEEVANFFNSQLFHTSVNSLIPNLTAIS